MVQSQQWRSLWSIHNSYDLFPHTDLFWTRRLLSRNVTMAPSLRGSGNCQQRCFLSNGYFLRNGETWLFDKKQMFCTYLKGVFLFYCSIQIQMLQDIEKELCPSGLGGVLLLTCFWRLFWFSHDIQYYVFGFQSGFSSGVKSSPLNQMN